MSALFRAKLSRPDSSTPWGFRLDGGIDLYRALNISKVTPGGLAEASGLCPGDLIIRINSSDTRFMKHEEAKMEIIRSSNDFELIIERGEPVAVAAANASGVPLQLEPLPRSTAVNIVPSGTEGTIPPPPKAGEAMLVPDTGGRLQRLSHSSYNSPMGLYSKENVDTSFKSTVLAAGANPSQVRGVPPIRGGSMYCGVCENLIAGGAFVKVQGRIPMHPECLKCVKCGIGLRNVGYFYINEKLYCELHAKQVARPADPGMKPVVVYK